MNMELDKDEASALLISIALDGVSFFTDNCQTYVGKTLPMWGSEMLFIFNQHYLIEKVNEDDIILWGDIQFLYSAKVNNMLNEFKLFVDFNDDIEIFARYKGLDFYEYTIDVEMGRDSMPVKLYNYLFVSPFNNSISDFHSDQINKLVGLSLLLKSMLVMLNKSLGFYIENVAPNIKNSMRNQEFDEDDYEDYDD